MTDHRPEVRRYKFPDRVIADYLAMRMRTEGETEYVLASDYDAAIAKLQAAPPIEPVGMREALENAVPRMLELTRFYKSKQGAAHTQDFDEAIKQAQAALAACEPKDEQ